MSGFVGFIGSNETVGRRLTSSFTARLERAGLRYSILLNSVASGIDEGLWQLNGTTILLYGEHPARKAIREATDLSEVESLPTQYVCSSAKIENGDSVSLRCDDSGTFPLYYYFAGQFFAFSTHLFDLAYALQPSLHAPAVVHFLRDGYIPSGHSIFSGIRRVQPGQSIECSLSRGLSVTENSRCWTDVNKVHIEELLELLSLEFARVTSKKTLMMSGGWDSRTILALDDAVDGCYFHGEIQSRECEIAKALSTKSGKTFEPHCIDESIYDLEFLENSFDRYDNLVFPHWHKAGLNLKSSCRSIVAGVYGEVLGGHYGPAMVKSRTLAKAVSLIRPVIGAKNTKLTASSFETVCSSLLSNHRNQPWYLANDFWLTVDRHEVREMCQLDFERLHSRGIPTVEQFVEAFVSEARGTQYINSQLLSVGSNCPIELPFARRPILQKTSAIQLRDKIHNRLNQAILRRKRFELLTYPMAATLIPASTPVWAQEISRGLRKLIEEGPLQRIGGDKHWGWVNFTFINKSERFQELVRSVSSEIFNLNELRRVADGIRQGTAPISFHPLHDQLMKVVTVDRLLRATKS